jgi:hypothetical protein
MLSYESAAEIAAPPERVWEVLTDGARYPEWDSGVTKVEGTVADGHKIKVFTEVGGDRAFPVRVATDAPRSMIWTGGMPLGLFTGVRTFTLIASDEGTSFHCREVFTGPLLGMVSKQMPDLQPSFDRFAAGLKAAAEA